MTASYRTRGRSVSRTDPAAQRSSELDTGGEAKKTGRRMARSASVAANATRFRSTTATTSSGPAQITGSGNHSTAFEIAKNIGTGIQRAARNQVNDAKAPAL